MNKILRSFCALIAAFATTVIFFLLAAGIATVVGEIISVVGYLWGLKTDAWLPLNDRWYEMVQIMGALGTIIGLVLGPCIAIEEYYKK